MKKIIIPLILGLVFLAVYGLKLYTMTKKVNEKADIILAESLQNGDIIFQTSTSDQSEAIQAATHSKYSHVGIIYDVDGAYFVYEAIKTVRMTPLKKWIRRGKDWHFVVKRLKKATEILTPSTLKKMKSIGEQFKGKPYDLYFDWSDDKMYCSELVWKIYKRGTGIEIGELQQLGDFDLSNEIVKSKLRERYGDHLPLTEKVIAPGTMFESPQLMTVRQSD